MPAVMGISVTTCHDPFHATSIYRKVSCARAMMHRPRRYQWNTHIDVQPDSIGNLPRGNLLTYVPYTLLLKTSFLEVLELIICWQNYKLKRISKETCPLSIGVVHCR